MTEESPKAFDTWAVVEIMGHCRHAGRVTEQTIGGGSFIRIDVPAIGDKPAYTKLFGHGSIYSITPCSEEFARAAEARFYNQPMAAIGIGMNETSDEDW